VSARSRAGFLVLVASFALAQAALHARAGFTFPPPWIDEAWFLWQAKAVADTGTLVAPQLHPERPILWMPPGYFVAAGAAFVLLGFDFALARALSLVCLLGCFVVLARWLRDLPHPFAALLLAGAYFLGPTFVATGNVARMEALLLVLVLAGFALLRGARPWTGLALLAASPLVHPNGLWFLAGGAVCIGLRARLGAALARPGALDQAVWAAVTAAWLGYAAFAAAFAEAFVHDLGHQLARKTAAGELAAAADSRLLALALLVALAFRLRRAIPDAVPLACLAASALAAASVGQEYWYEVFEDFFYLLLCVLALEAAMPALERIRAAARRPRLALVCVWLALLLASGAARRVPGPLDLARGLVWHRMRFSDGEPYLTAEDRAFVRGFLVGLASEGERPLVRFQPAAEALFYADLDGREFRVSEPLFHTQAPDWYLLRASRWLPGGRIARARFAAAGVDPEGGADRIRERGGTERWYALRARADEPGR
jgi:hypothetical protein